MRPILVAVRQQLHVDQCLEGDDAKAGGVVDRGDAPDDSRGVGMSGRVCSPAKVDAAHEESEHDAVLAAEGGCGRTRCWGHPPGGSAPAARQPPTTSNSTGTFPRVACE